MEQVIAVTRYLGGQILDDQLKETRPFLGVVRPDDGLQTFTQLNSDRGWRPAIKREEYWM